MAAEAKIKITAVDNTQRAFNSLRKNLNESQRGFKRLTGLVAGAGGGAAFLALVKNSLAAGDALDKLSKQTGFAVEAIQKYRFAAGQSGVDQDKFNTGLQAFAKRMGELKNNTGELFSFLKKYDEELVRSLQSTKTSDEAFRTLADAMSKIGDTGTQAALGSAAFSRSAGIELAQLLAQGTGAIDEYGKQLQATGSIMSETATGGAAEANDALDRLSKSTLGLATVFAVELGPTIAVIADALREGLPKAFDYVRLKVTDFLEIVIPGMEAISSAIADVLLWVDRFVEGFSELPNKAGKAIAQMAEETVGWMGELATKGLDKANEFFEGVTEGAKEMAWEVVGGSYVPDMVKGIETWFGKLPEVMEKPAEAATDFVTDAFSNMRDRISDILVDVLTGVRSFGDALKSLGRQILDNLIRGGVGKILGVFGLGGVSGSVSAGGLGGIGKLLGLGGRVTSGAGGEAIAAAALDPILGMGAGGGASLGGGFGLSGLANPAFLGPLAGFGVLGAIHALGGRKVPFRADQRASAGLTGGFQDIGGGIFGAGIVGTKGAGGQDFAKSLKGITEIDLQKYFDGARVKVERFGDELLVSNQHFDMLVTAIQDGGDTMVGTFENTQARAKAAFARLSSDAQRRLRSVQLDSVRVGEIMADSIITAAEAAELGILGFGTTTAAVFREMINQANAAAQAAASVGDIKVPNIQQVPASRRSVSPSLGDNAAGLLPRPRVYDQRLGDLAAQHGGTFQVEGRAGVDQNSLRVSRGERITVETPGQAGKQVELLHAILRQLTRQGTDIARYMSK